MTARPEEAAVTVAPAPPPAPVFRVGDVVRESVPAGDDDGGGAIEYHYGTVVAGVPPSPVPQVWVEFRRIPGQHAVPASDLELLDVDRAVRGTLDLLARVGIRVVRHEVGISPEAGALICDDDEPGEHDEHAQSLVLWFESMDDVMALQELSYRGPFEFGCSWPSIYADLGLDASPTRPATDDPVIIRAVHLADLPTLADLARRELAGEFGGSAKAIRLRWLARSTVQVAAATVALQVFRVIILGGTLGWLGALCLVTAAYLLGRALYRRGRYGRPVPRRHLDAVRTRSRQVVRGGGPR